MLKIKTFLSLFLLFMTLLGCERADITDLLEPQTDTQPITLMTYNVYVGSSTEKLLNVENLLQVPTEVANMYNNAIASDFPARATAIAKSIKTHQPHLIGLQEISLVRRQSPGDRITGGTTPAENVVSDFLKTLMDALQAEGLNYQVAAKVQNFDVEMPMFTDTGIDDVRLTDYDVILARGDVAIADAIAANYENAFTVDMLGLAVVRGYTAVDATIDGTTYRVVNTHLESFSEAARVAQTQELIDSLANEPKPILLLGDFNTPAPDGIAYQMLLEAGYRDVWQTDANGTGSTCCQDSDIRNENSAHYERIDLIFVRHLRDVDFSAMAFTLGDQPAERLPSGLWPSDHAGVVAEIEFTHP